MLLCENGQFMMMDQTLALATNGGAKTGLAWRLGYILLHLVLRVPSSGYWFQFPFVQLVTLAPTCQQSTMRTRVEACFLERRRTLSSNELRTPMSHRRGTYGRGSVDNGLNQDQSKGGESRN